MSALEPQATSASDICGSVTSKKPTSVASLISSLAISPPAFEHGAFQTRTLDAEASIACCRVLYQCGQALRALSIPSEFLAAKPFHQAAEQLQALSSLTVSGKVNAIQASGLRSMRLDTLQHFTCDIIPDSPQPLFHFPCLVSFTSHNNSAHALLPLGKPYSALDSLREPADSQVAIPTQSPAIA